MITFNSDYIELTINTDGTIDNWPNNPELLEFVEKGTQPHPIKTHKWHHAKAALQYIKSLMLNKEV
ncbi:MAG: hypothetical protein CW341_00650 [Bacteroidetes bacterium]|nr:hypothetical protein [Bacteroidota bacterium]